MEEAFEVKIKKNGTTISRHIYANSPDQAKIKCEGRKNGKKKRNFRVIGVKKVRASDLIGDVNTFRLIKEVVGKVPPTNNIIEEGTTIGEIIFNRHKKEKEVEHTNKEDLWYKNKKNKLATKEEW